MHVEDTTEPASGTDELTVAIDGQEYTVEENVDFDGDGDNDTAVLQASDGAVIAIADTDHDGIADVAVEYDPETGEWHPEDVDALPTPSGAGADDTADDTVDS
jgi:hypothetical protein